MTYHRTARSTLGTVFFSSHSGMNSAGYTAKEIIEKGLRTPFNEDDIQQILSLLTQTTQSNSVSSDIRLGKWLYDHSATCFTIQIAKPDGFPNSPYAVKGGSARALLLTLLGIPSLPARDMDLLRKGSVRIKEDEVAAARYMPNDYRNGARVELFTESTRYLATRDITINEVLYMNQELRCSPFAALDALATTLRPSRYRSGTLSKPPSLSGRTFLKMVRLRAELLEAGSEWTIVGIPETLEFSESELAIELGKALEHGPKVATSFLHHLVAAEFLPAPEDSSALLQFYLQELQVWLTSNQTLSRKE